MLHAKFQGNWPSGSGEDDFLRVKHFWARRPSCDLDHLYKLSFPLPKVASHGFDWSSSFRGEDVWKCERTTDRNGPWVYYKLTLWAWRLKWARNPLLVDKKCGWYSNLYTGTAKFCGGLHLSIKEESRTAIFKILVRALESKGRWHLFETDEKTWWLSWPKKN